MRAVQHQRKSQLAAIEQRLQLRVFVVEPSHETHLNQSGGEFGLTLDDLE